MVTYARVRIADDGRISPVGAEPTRERLDLHGEYRLQHGPAGAWLLTPPNRPEGGTLRVLMMGEIVSRMTVVEVLNIITSVHWRGELHIVERNATRILVIDQGALKHAQTDRDEERLGEQLVRAGLLSRDDLARHLPNKPKDRRLGQLLVEAGLLSGEELFRQLQRQAENIFFASLLAESGQYWFVTPSHEGLPTTIHAPLTGLLMEGVQRLDEMALFRERIPHNRLYPSVNDTRPSRVSLEPNALSLLALCDGTRNIDELARITSQGEFPTLKLIYGLLGTGHVRLLSGPTLDRKAAESMLRLFNDIMRDIFLAVATYGSVERVRTKLNEWVESSPQMVVTGGTVDVDGTLPLASVLAQLEALSPGQNPLEALHRALHELIAYALFTASNGLPRHEEQSLSREVNHRLKLLKL